MHDTTPKTTAIDVFTHFLDLDAHGAIGTAERAMADSDADWRLAMFHAESAADVHPDHWEKHPFGDEAVCCLHGAISLCLRSAVSGTPDDVVRLLPGQAAIVPRDRWHRFEFEEPTDLLAITVRRGTELEKRT